MPNAFRIKQHKPNLNPIVWDKYYLDVKAYKAAVKVGEGDEDYTLVLKEKVTKTSIKQVIDSQADDVGLENILKKFAITGDESILPQSVNSNGGEVIDMTQLPNDLIEADNFYKQQKAMFDSLPVEITKGRSFAEFMTNFNQAEFNAYVAALAAAQAKPIEDGGDK